jgi:hypothetical protein
MQGPWLLTRFSRVFDEGFHHEWAFAQARLFSNALRESRFVSLELGMDVGTM